MGVKNNLQFVKDHYPDALIVDGFDDAIIGIAERYGMNPVVLYDTRTCIKIRQDRYNMK